MSTCRGPECDRPVAIKKHGVCKGHYNQLHSGKPLTPLRRYVRADQSQGDSRTCTKCGQTKHLSEFYVRSNGRIHSHCKACMIADNGRANAIRYARERAQKASQSV